MFSFFLRDIMILIFGTTSQIDQLNCQQLSLFFFNFFMTVLNQATRKHCSQLT